MNNSLYFKKFIETPDHKFVDIISKKGYPISRGPKKINENNKGYMILSLNIYNNSMAYIPYDEVPDVIMDLNNKGQNPPFCEVYNYRIHDKVKFIADIDKITYNTEYQEKIDNDIKEMINSQIAPLFGGKLHIATSHGLYYSNQPEKLLGEKPGKIEPENKDFCGSDPFGRMYNRGYIDFKTMYGEYFNIVQEYINIHAIGSHTDENIIVGNGKYKFPKNEKLLEIFLLYVEEYNNFKIKNRYDEGLYNTVLDNLIREIRNNDLSSNKKYKPCYKYSYHIVADRYFKSMEHIKHFIFRHNLENIVDIYIYTSERKMRLPYCIKGYNISSKFNDKRIMKIITKSDLSDFFITYTEDNFEVEPEPTPKDMLIGSEFFKDITNDKIIDSMKSHIYQNSDTFNLNYILNSINYLDINHPIIYERYKGQLEFIYILWMTYIKREKIKGSPFGSLKILFKTFGFETMKYSSHPPAIILKEDINITSSESVPKKIKCVEKNIGYIPYQYYMSKPELIHENENTEYNPIEI